MLLLSLGFFDLEFVCNLFCACLLGMRFDLALLVLCFDRSAESYGAVDRDDLHVFRHHRKRVIFNDHLTNVRSEFDVDRIIGLVGGGLRLIVAIPLVLAVLSAFVSSHQALPAIAAAENRVKINFIDDVLIFATTTLLAAPLAFLQVTPYLGYADLICWLMLARIPSGKRSIR